MSQSCKITFYGLSTCPHCRKAKELLESLHLDFDFFYVDKMEGSEREAMIERVKRHNPRVSFPTMVFYHKDENDADKVVVVGFKENEINEAVNS